MLPVPTTVVSGFLGSGKTTLINRILEEEHGHAIAVIVNDVGDLDVDAALLSEQGDEVVSLRNGCICCSMQGDLVAQLARLVQEQDLDHIIIEASGVSEPGNIVRGINYPHLRGKVLTSAVVTLVDTELFPELSGNAKYLAGEQLAAADVVLLNKVDLVSAQQLDAVTESCACPRLPIIKCTYADIHLDLFFSTEYTSRSRAGLRHGSVANEQFESQVWRPAGPVDLDVLRQVVLSISDSVIRTKGFVQQAGDGEYWLIQVVGRRTNFTQFTKCEDTALTLISTRCGNDWASIISQLDTCVVNDKYFSDEASTRRLEENL